MNGATSLPEVLWQACDPDDLLWAHWGNDHVVFHRPSGQTHFVNEATAYLLQEGLVRPTPLAEITRALGAHAGDGADEFVAHLEDLLSRFEALGLVRCVSA